MLSPGRVLCVIVMVLHSNFAFGEMPFNVSSVITMV